MSAAKRTVLWAILVFLAAADPPAAAGDLLVQGFEDGVMPPVDWSTVDTNPSANWSVNNATWVHTGSWAAWVNYDSTQPSDEWLRSPTIDLAGVWDGVATFWAASDTSYCPVSGSGATMLFHVTDPAFVAIATPWDMCVAESWPVFDYRPVALSLTPFHDQVIRIAWRYVGFDGESFALDDVLVTGTRSGPVLFPPWPGPPYAHPAVTIDPPIPDAGQPTQLCAQVVNHDGSAPHNVEIELSRVSGFAIGVPYSPISSPITVMAPPGGTGSGCVTFVPPFAGPPFIQARLIAGYEGQVVAHNLDLEPSLQASVPHDIPFLVGNPTPTTATATLGLIPHLSGYTISLSQDVFPNIPPGGTEPVTLTITPPSVLPIPATAVVDVEGFIGTGMIGGFRVVHYPPHIFADGFESGGAEAWGTVQP
jgi:hypothetical protein